MSHYYGLIRQTPDPRDLKFTVSKRTTNVLSSSYDVSSRTGPMLNQGALGTCGPNTTAECIDYDELAENQALAAPSRLYIYFNTRYLQGSVSTDSGVQNRTMLKALAIYGYCPETMWPYSDDKTTFLLQPSQDCYTTGGRNLITNYASVAVDLNQMKGVISTGFPFIFGTYVFQGIESDAAASTGIVPMPASGEQPIGGHDVSFVGYSDIQQPGVKPGNIWPAGTFKFRNHWLNNDGSLWGDGGYGYFSYAAATNANWVSDLWVINAVPGVAVTPPPPPVNPTPAQLTATITASMVGTWAKIN
jgi:C1A family cysteine protease